MPVTTLAEPAVPSASDAFITTYAGSGLAGMDDGKALQARFLAPVGITADASGAIFVADAAAQRIRRIDPNGTVSTVAGSGSVDRSGMLVRGGFADGPAAQAQFNEPSGIAIAPDGALIVADRLNHCLRRIAKGSVSLYAGATDAAGHADGALADARFAQPMALAFDAAGNLFVADFGNGVREIDTSGHVTTTILPQGRGLGATSVSISTEGGHEILMVALRSGIARLDLTAQQTTFYVGGAPPVEQSFFADSPDRIFIEAMRDIGTAYAIAPLGDHRFVYTDLANHAVRLIWNRRERVLAGGGDDAAFSAGAFEDGPGPSARFDAPAGIVRLGKNRFAIADAGNRRIRIVTLRLPQEDDLEALSAANRSYRIAYVGNSYVDYDGDTSSSITSLVERTLNGRASEIGLKRPVQLFTVKQIADASALGSYIRNYFSGTANLVIWQLNSAEIATLAPGMKLSLAGPPSSAASVWQPALVHELQATRDALAADNTQLLVVFNPLPWEVSPEESAYQRLYDLDVAPWDEARREVELEREALNRSSVHWLDLFPAFESAEHAARRQALYGTVDHHFSRSGRELVAREIAGELVRRKPWTASP